MSTTILQLHKRASYEFKNIQDKFAFNENNKCFALSDGTTQSFNSETWAKLLVDDFVDSPTFDFQTLIANFTGCVERYKNSKFEFSANPAKASLEKTKQNKGGTATFIGLQFLQGNRINIISCGDTNLFIVRKKGFDCFPYSDIESLDANNFFINTEQLLQNKIDETYFQVKTFSFQYGDTILLATDALSRLLLKQPSIISELVRVLDFDAFHKFCLTYWNRKEMEEDDISAIIIKIENKNIIQYILPPTDFSFPKEEENLFVPTPLIQQAILNPFDSMNTQEIKDNFNGIANDFQRVKMKMKLQEILLMSAIGVGLLNIFCSFYFRPNSSKVEKEISDLKKENGTFVTRTQADLAKKDEKISDLEQKNRDLVQKMKEAKDIKVRKENATKIDGGNPDAKIKADKPITNQSKPKK